MSKQSTEYRLANAAEVVLVFHVGLLKKGLLGPSLAAFGLLGGVP